MKNSVMAVCRKMYALAPTCILLLFFGSVQAETKPATNVVSMAALPIITESIVALSPTFGGKRNPVIMQQVCLLANGQQTMEEFKSFFSSKNISLKELAVQDKGFALIASDDIDQLKIACAAYTASSVLVEPDLSEFIEPLTEEAAKIEAEKIAKAAKKKLEAGTDLKPTAQINQVKLATSLSHKLAVSQTNAAFFATIATQLEQLPVDSLSGYREKTQALFSSLAALYLVNVNTSEKDKTTLFNLLQIQNGHFAFVTSTGYLFDFTQQGMSLRLNNINWFGSGELLGKKYMLNVAYLPDGTIPLLQINNRP